MSELRQDFSALSDCGKIVSNLGIAAPPEDWLRDWMASQASFRLEDCFFLQERYIRAACRLLHMTLEVEQAFLSALPMFQNSAALQRLIWHCHHALFVNRTATLAEIATWPDIPRSVSDTADMFYAVLFLSGISALQEIYKQRQISESVLVETLTDLALWMQHHHDTLGVWGLSDKEKLFPHFNGTLFSLGRLQFEMQAFPYDFHIFHHRRQKQVLILAGNGMLFRPDGYFADSWGMKPPEKCWSAPFEATDAVIHGIEVFPAGRVVPRTMDFAAEAWEEVVCKSTPVLFVHIPSSGPLIYPQCITSLNRSKEFFARYFPEFAWRAYACISWFLDAQFVDHMPADSNIIRFQQMFRLFPVPGADDSQMLHWVFGGPVKDLERAPRDTGLRRVILGHMERGGRWITTGGVLVPDK